MRNKFSIKLFSEFKKYSTDILGEDIFASSVSFVSFFNMSLILLCEVDLLKSK